MTSAAAMSAPFALSAPPSALAGFPEGRRRFIRWVEWFGHRAVARELWLLSGYDKGRASDEKFDNLRKVVHSWTNRRAERLIMPKADYAAHIVKLSKEHPAPEIGSLSLADLQAGTPAALDEASFQPHAWRYLCTGELFDILRPDLTKLTPAVIAQHLANQPRFGGAVKVYSVAQHCCLGAEYLFERPRRRTSTGDFTLEERRAFAFDFLMHDAAEAIMPDVISPIKRILLGPLYVEHERFLDAALAKHHGYRSAVNNDLGSEDAQRIDMRMLATEEVRFFGRNNFAAAKPLPIEISVWDEDLAAARWLDLYEQYKPKARTA